MSNVLECIVHPEPTPFFASEFKKEALFTFTDELKLDPSLQDENTCQTNIPAVRQAASRKREASNVLMECAKKRENMQNISYATDMPFWPIEIKADVSTLNLETTVVENEKCKIENSVGADSPMSVESSDVSTVDSGIETSISGSLDQSTDVASAICSDEENHIYSVNTCIDSIKANVENDDGAKSESLSHVINENLVELCLDEKPYTSRIPSTKIIKPALAQSLFTNSPPVLYFPSEGEELEKLPEELASLLRWKLTTVTPPVVKELVTKIGFNLLEIETTESWLGLWGKHLKCLSYRSLLPFQKVNHFPGGYHLGRKDRFWKNYKRMLTKYGEESFDFFPSTYILPADKKLLRSAWDKVFCWIIKPCASARGTGVKVIQKWSQVPKDKPYVVQKYISDPYLINGTKFDLRIYVLVSSIEPLRIYMYEDGLVRFASKKYRTTNQSLKNSYIHLTNYSINKKSASYASNNDENACQGHKWSLKSFWVYMAENGIDVPKIKQTILDMIIKTIICSEGPICKLIKLHATSAYNCFELFGFDIMLDKDLKPWLLEVNITPSLHTKSMLDSKIKTPMIRDMLNIIGFELPHTVLGENSCFKGNRHRPFQFKNLSAEEKNKHSFYTFKHIDIDTEILNNLTLDDLSCLMESEDELQRAKIFTRIFPSVHTHSYDKYFDHIRYYNVLLDVWEQTYAHDRQKGIEFLRNSYKNLAHQNTCVERREKSMSEI